MLEIPHSHLKKGLYVVKHINVTEKDAEQTIAKPLDKRPVKLHQKKSDERMYKDKLVTPELQPQEDCHGMTKHMCNQEGWGFSEETASMFFSKYSVERWSEKSGRR